MATYRTSPRGRRKKLSEEREREEYCRYLAREEIFQEHQIIDYQAGMRFAYNKLSELTDDEVWDLQEVRTKELEEQYKDLTIEELYSIARENRFLQMFIDREDKFVKDSSLLAEGHQYHVSFSGEIELCSLIDCSIPDHFETIKKARELRDGIGRYHLTKEQCFNKDCHASLHFTKPSQIEPFKEKNKRLHLNHFGHAELCYDPQCLEGSHYANEEEAYTARQASLVFSHNLRGEITEHYRSSSQSLKTDDDEWGFSVAAKDFSNIITFATKQEAFAYCRQTKHFHLTKVRSKKEFKIVPCYDPTCKKTERFATQVEAAKIVASRGAQVSG